MPKSVLKFVCVRGLGKNKAGGVYAVPLVMITL